VKHLIINSDDFGACHSINEGVVRGFREGILTQATLMVPCPWFEEAAALAKEYGLPVGVHLTATCEWDRYRWRPITPARSFTCPDGTLPRSIAEVQKRADPAELEAEYVAQVELVLARGIEPSHFDVHMSLVDAEVTARVIRRYGIRSRYAVGPGYEDCLFPFASTFHLTNASLPSGMDKAEYLRRYIEGIGEGVHFVCCHLAVRSSEMRAISSKTSPWAEDLRATDLDAILAPGLRELCHKRGIQLISLKDYPA
jgi:predicted glycoside hydrolase/deacetylase ChbG (UPF0249 family)